MTNFIPVFPLNIIVYPNEPLNLHIFEPRYKQLIKECLQASKSFGMPVVLNKKVQEYGTVMEITELVKEYPGGEMDIRARGTQIFRVLEIIKEIPDKLYSGAIVNYPDNVIERDDTQLANLIMSEESSRSRTASMASDMFQLGRVRPLDETTAAIEKVTAKSIQKYFDAVPPRDFTVVTLGPQELSL